MSERRSELKAVSAATGPALSVAGRDMSHLTTLWVENWSQINGRLMSFAQASLRNSISAAEQLRQCQSPTDLVETQMKLAQQAYGEYLDESRSLSELVIKLSSDALASAAATPQSR